MSKRASGLLGQVGGGGRQPGGGGDILDVDELEPVVTAGFEREGLAAQTTSAYRHDLHHRNHRALSRAPFPEWPANRRKRKKRKPPSRQRARNRAALPSRDWTHIGALR
jgi:hypothetical protein